MRWILLLLLPACPPGEKPDDSAAATAWYFTCGDPACSGYSGPFDGVPLCTDETAGAACDSPDATCDPQDSCNALLVCASEDPTQQTGGCPISRARHKRDIVYLDPGDVSEVAAQAKGINATGLSREEYAWVRRQSLVAMSQLVDPAALAGMVELPPGVPRITTPDPADEAALAAARHNAALLRPHVPLLQQTLGGIPASR